MEQMPFRILQLLVFVNGELRSRIVLEENGLDLSFFDMPIIEIEDTFEKVVETS